MTQISQIFNDMATHMVKDLFNCVRNDNSKKLIRLLNTLEDNKEAFKDINININVKNKQGNTLLMSAVLNNNFSVFCDILKYNPDINESNDNRETSLMMASIKDIKYVHKLLEEGADVLAKDKAGNSALSCAEKQFSKEKDIIILLKEKIEERMIQHLERLTFETNKIKDDDALNAIKNLSTLGFKVQNYTSC